VKADKGGRPFPTVPSWHHQKPAMPEGENEWFSLSETIIGEMAVDYLDPH
jgi:hypothetical protein